MSHFVVGVIVEKDLPIKEQIENILAPYDENLEVDKYVCRDREDILEEMLDRRDSLIDLDYDDLDEEDQFLVDAETDEDILKYYADFWAETELDEDGNELSTYNPNSKWDWYEVGGRWRDILYDKAYNKMTSWCRIGDIDFNKCVKMSEEDARYLWEVAVLGLHKNEEKAKELFILWKPEYYIERYGNIENFIKIKTTFALYAIADKDGWHQKGQMGWFGCDDSTLESELKFLDKFQDYMSDEKNQDKVLIIVDCHI